jgi:hypothetical protein
VQNNPVNYKDPYGESIVGKVVVLAVKGADKAYKVIKRGLNLEDAVRNMKEGENIICKSRNAMRDVAKRASDGERPIHEIDKKTGRPHYHTHDRSGGHGLYGLAAALTFSHYAEGNGQAAEAVAFGADLINPLSLPNDVLEIRDTIANLMSEED